MLEYTSKFIECSHFALTYMTNEKLRMNPFEAKLNPSLKEQMSVRHYTLYEDMYDTAVTVKRVMKERNEFYNEQRGVKRRRDQ